MRHALLLLAFATLLSNCQKNEIALPTADDSQRLPQLMHKKWVQTNPAEGLGMRTFEPNDHFTPRYEFGEGNQVVYTYGTLNGTPACGVGLTDCNGNSNAAQPAAARGTYRVESSESGTVISLQFSEKTFSKTWELVSLDDKALKVREK